MVALDAKRVLEAVGKRLVAEAENELSDLTSISNLADSYVRLHEVVERNEVAEEINRNAVSGNTMSGENKLFLDGKEITKENKDPYELLKSDQLADM